MSTILSSDPQVVSQPLFSSSSVALQNLGERVVSPDGRSFRYCQAGASALVPGKLYQAPAQVTNHQDLVPAAAAAGATSVTVTLGATAVAANQYAGGYMVVTVTPGQGYQYLISSHPAADASATLELTLSDPIQVALTTSSNVDLVSNPFKGVIINPTTASSCVAGVAVYPVAAGEYGWLQTGGVATCLVDDQTITVGTNVAASNQAAGAIEPATGVQQIIGRAVTGGATTEYVAVELLLV